MKKYIAYYRKSTDTEDKQVLSLDGQKREVREYAQQKDIAIPKNLEFEESQSAKTPQGRPIFNKILALLKDKKADGIIAYKLDRISRNPVDLGYLIQLMEDKGIEICTTDFGIYDNTMTGKMILGFSGLVSKAKIDGLSEDTQRGMEDRASKGWWPGWAPHGYLNIDVQGKIAGKQYTTEKQRLLESKGRDLYPIEKDPIINPLIQKAFELYYYEDYSLKTLLQKLTAEGLISRTGKKLTKSALQFILSNPFYYGVMEYKGEFRKANHERTVNKELFVAVQDKLSGKTHPRTSPKELDFIYKGILFCGECGCAITAERHTKNQKNGNVHKYIYYRCTKAKGYCSQSYIKEKDLEEKLSSIFGNFIISEGQAKAISEKLNELFIEDLEYQENQEKQLKTRFTKISDEKKNLFRKMVSGEIEDKEMYLELKNDIESEVHTIQEKLENIKRHSSDWLDQTSNLLYLAQHAQELFLEGTKEEKQTLINCVASNLFLRDKTVEFSLKEPFAFLENIEDGQTLLPR